MDFPTEGLDLEPYVVGPGAKLSPSTASSGSSKIEATNALTMILPTSFSSSSPDSSQSSSAGGAGTSGAGAGAGAVEMISTGGASPATTTDEDPPSPATKRNLLYDLYAVAEHSGGLASGHYTAKAMNPKNGKWSACNYSFGNRNSFLSLS